MLVCWIMDWRIDSKNADEVKVLDNSEKESRNSGFPFIFRIFYTPYNEVIILNPKGENYAI